MTPLHDEVCKLNRAFLPRFLLVMVLYHSSRNQTRTHLEPNCVETVHELSKWWMVNTQPRENEHKDTQKSEASWQLQRLPFVSNTLWKRKDVSRQSKQSSGYERPLRQELRNEL